MIINLLNIKLRYSFLFLLVYILLNQVHAAQSSITNAKGSACLNQGETKKQVESQALLDAKRQAVEFAKTYVSVQTKVKNFKLEKDLIKSFAQAEVKVLSIVKQSWDEKNTCYFISLMAEVFPVSTLLNMQSDMLMNNPTAPLTVKLWTNQLQFRPGQYMKIYIKGNKPFYGRLTYKDASGNLLQVLPNPNRSEYHFNGSVTYQVPDMNDNFELLVAPPLGIESLTLYASTAPLGKVEKQNIGGVYKLTQGSEKIAYQTRGIRIISVNSKNNNAQDGSLAEFDEASVQTEIIEYD